VAQAGAWLGTRRGRWAAAGLFVVVAVGWLGLMWFGFGGHDNTGPFVESQPPPGLAERFYPPEGWAWGLIQVGETPAQRYGVVGSSGTPRVQVLILPDYGESAEDWFETARDLGATGATVWVLDGVGQGGSARLTRHRDLGEVTSFDSDVAAVRAMIEIVIQPKPSVPLVILGEGQGAIIAMRAAETGATPAALILSSLQCRTVSPGRGWILALGFGAQRAPGGSGWRRDAPDAFAQHRTHDRWRGAVGRLWQIANPDLRMGGPSRDWLAADARLQTEAQSDVARIQPPTLVIDPAGVPACLSPPGATTLTLPGASPSLELEDDVRRNAWLGAIEDFVATHTRLPVPPPLTITRRNAPFQHRHRSVASPS
jgi:lysophospholipase